MCTDNSNSTYMDYLKTVNLIYCLKELIGVNDINYLLKKRYSMYKIFLILCDHIF